MESHASRAEVTPPRWFTRLGRSCKTNQPAPAFVGRLIACMYYDLPKRYSKIILNFLKRNPGGQCP